MGIVPRGTAEMNTTTPEFVGFPKMARLCREMIVTEKIDGTNAQILITEDGDIQAGSRTRWITPEDDNFGFAAWVRDNRDDLLNLGPGRHFGEWWGSGIQRGYGLQKGEKRFSLFNVSRWHLHGTPAQRIHTADPRIEKWQDELPACCGLVPLIYSGPFDTGIIGACVERLEKEGSFAAPGFMRPEGVIAFHVAANIGFKRTIEKDGEPKSLHQ
jgi:hypothetical protein